MGGSLRKIQAWDSVNGVWVNIKADPSGYLQLEDLGDILKATDLNIDGTKDLQVDVKTSGLPTGAATSAKQDIIITALQLIDDLRNALGSVDTDDLQVDVKSQADKERQMLGYDGSTWKKLGMIFNYNDVIGEIISGIATGATHQLFSTEVPAGEVHIIQNVWFRNDVTNGNLLLQIYNGDLADYLSVQYIDQASIILGIHLDLSNPIVLKAGDKLRGLATGCIVDDTLSMQITGYKMLVS